MNAAKDSLYLSVQKISNFEHTPGIYYNYSKSSILQQNMENITYLNIKIINSNFIDNAIDKTKYYCNENHIYRDLLFCKSSIPSLERLIPKIKSEEAYLTDLLDAIAPKEDGLML